MTEAEVAIRLAELRKEVEALKVALSKLRKEYKSHHHGDFPYAGIY
jgi:hypothetical protein